MLSIKTFKINRRTINAILCALSFLFLFLQYTEYTSSIITVLSVLLPIFLWLDILRDGIKRNELIMIFSFGIYDVILISFQVGSIQSFLVFLPIALYCIKSEKIGKIPFFITASLILLLTFVSWINSPNAYLIFNSMSRNYVSVFAMYALAIVNICYEKENQECPFIFFVITWFICLSARGRGGILASSIIVILEYAYKLFNRQKKRGQTRLFRIVALVVIATAFVIYVYINFDQISNTYLLRFFGGEASAESSTEARLYMINQYLKACRSSAFTFLFGANASEISLVGNNMHNSYIQLHSGFGIIGLFFVLAMSVKGLIYLVKNNKVTSAIVFLGILIRAGADWCFPGFPLEIFLWYYMLLPEYNKRRIATVIAH